MNDEVLNWLMEGPAWIRYAVETQLLGKNPDVRPVLEDRLIAGIISRVKGSQAGLPALPAHAILRSAIEHTDHGISDPCYLRVHRYLWSEGGRV